MKHLICIGKIASVHGVHGTLKLDSYTQNPEDLFSYGPLFDKHGKELALNFIKSHKNQLLAEMDGVSDRNKAQTYQGIELYVPREALPEAEEGSYYHTDLIGMQVIDEDGAEIGTVKALFNFGAGDIIEITLTNGKTEMFPFNEETILDVDLRKNSYYLSYQTSFMRKSSTAMSPRIYYGVRAAAKSGIAPQRVRGDG